MPIVPGIWVGAEDISIQVMSGAYERLGGLLEVCVPGTCSSASTLQKDISGKESVHLD